MNRYKISIIFFIISFISISTSLTYSVFKSNGTGNANIDIANWEVLLDTDNENTISLTSGVDAKNYKIKVKNNSEVTIKYTIVLTNLPTGVEVALDEGNFEESINNTLTFSNVNQIKYNDSVKEKEHTLKFKSNLGTTEVENQEVGINVKFEQVY